MAITLDVSQTGDQFWQYGLAAGVFAAVFAGITVPIVKALIAHQAASIDLLRKSVDAQISQGQSLQVAVQTLQKVDDRVVILTAQLDRRTDELSEQIEDLKREQIEELKRARGGAA